MRSLLLIVAVTLFGSARADPEPHRDLNLNLDEWLRAQAEEEAVSSGRVDPVWRAAQRRIEAELKPDARVITDENPIGLFIGQLVRSSRVAAEPHEREARGANTIAEDIAERLRLERAFEETPAAWRQLEIAVECASGAPPVVQVEFKSGSGALDDLAVVAVKRSLAVCPTTSHERVRVHFAVDAGVVIQPPTLAESHHRVGGSASFKFDETTGKVRPKIWFTKRVLTRIRVKRIERLR